MASNKRSALRQQRAAFESQLSGLDDVFAREERRQNSLNAHKETARKHKACSSKNRYPTGLDARIAIAACEERGITGLSCYRCTYCNGWHLTSHPR